jgi:hypothetical protein
VHVLVNLGINDPIFQLPESSQQSKMRLELRGGYKGVLRSFPPYREADLVKIVGRWGRMGVRGTRGRTCAIDGIPRRRSVLA